MEVIVRKYKKLIIQIVETAVVVSVFAFSSDNPSSNPVEAFHSFSEKFVFEMNERKQTKEAWVGPINTFKSNEDLAQVNSLEILVLVWASLSVYERLLVTVLPDIMVTVLPDVKESQFFQNFPKSSQSSFYFESDVLENSHKKSRNIWATFFKKIVPKNLQTCSIWSH